MRSARRYFVVDAFTNRPFAGNPAAVVPLDRWEDEGWLQSVAMEMNLSETAFFVANHEGYDLRWFTPMKEVDLCGHATLATAFVLAETGKLVDGATISFSTRSGILRAERQGSRFLLDFPALFVQPSAPPPDLLESLNAAEAVFVGQSKFDFLVQVESAKVVRHLAPDFARLAKVKCRGVVVTAQSDDPKFDFMSRFFAPVVGVNEDPVTGSAHCLLAPHWASRLGKVKMVGYQASPRGGIVHVEHRADRVILGGEAVIFSTGEIAVD
jgi:predicted PhzF superfamily epimerase YddE/YHI9